MKIIKKYILIALSLFLCLSAHAQRSADGKVIINKEKKEIEIQEVDSIQLYGLISDVNGDPITGAQIAVLKDEQIITGSVSDFDGTYEIRGLVPGEYDLSVHTIEYPIKIIKGVKLEIQSVQENIQFTKTDCGRDIICEFPVFYDPMIDVSNTSSGTTLNSDDLRNMGF